VSVFTDVRSTDSAANKRANDAVARPSILLPCLHLYYTLHHGEGDHHAHHHDDDGVRVLLRPRRRSRCAITTAVQGRAPVWGRTATRAARPARVPRCRLGRPQRPRERAVAPRRWRPGPTVTRRRARATLPPPFLHAARARACWAPARAPAAPPPPARRPRARARASAPPCPSSALTLQRARTRPRKPWDWKRSRCRPSSR
jgi:hypothetical protein